jgi:hypothetical protein
VLGDVALLRKSGGKRRAPKLGDLDPVAFSELAADLEALSG